MGSILSITFFILFLSLFATADEVAPPPELPCFNGVYYRKAVSSMDAWSGIEGVITLPMIQLDNSRIHHVKGRHLDNPSIYLGGNAQGKQEIDAGLTWEIIRKPDGSVSKKARAFRPFWRNEKWRNAPAKPEYYYYPGDKVRMSCRIAGQGKLKLEVALISRAGQKTQPSQPISVFSTVFDAWAFGPGKKQQFKRVNAIDQVGNEGKDVQPTSATVSCALWQEVWLLRGDERLPMNKDRFTDMRCPDAKYFYIVPLYNERNGAELISISGKGFGSKVNPFEK